MDEIRCAIELRADDSRQSPGRLVGKLIEYERRAVDRPEMFAAGALTWPADGVILNLSHDRKQPVLRFTPELRGNAVMVDVALPDTTRGRDAAVMVRNGTLRGLSVEFRSHEEGQRDGMRLVRRAALHGAALVDDASYGNGVEVRDKGASPALPSARTVLF